MVKRDDVLIIFGIGYLTLRTTTSSAIKRHILLFSSLSLTLRSTSTRSPFDPPLRTVILTTPPRVNVPWWSTLANRSSTAVTRAPSTATV